MPLTKRNPSHKVILFFAFAYGLAWAAGLSMAVRLPGRNATNH